MKFAQLAVAFDPENGDVLYALGNDGQIYERTSVCYGPGMTYQGRNIQRGRAFTPPFWRKVDLPFVEPPLEDRKLHLFQFEEEK